MNPVESLKLKYPVNNPGGRALEAFGHKVRGKPGVQSEINKEVIYALANTNDWTAVKVDLKWKWKGNRGRKKSLQALIEFIRQRAEANDRSFFINLGRALTDGCGNKNAPINDFLFTNWDQIQGSVDGKRAFLREDIGLKHFTDNAVLEMLAIRFPDRALSQRAYRHAKKSASLKSEKPARIKSVTQDGNGQIRLFRKKLSPKQSFYWRNFVR